MNGKFLTCDASNAKQRFGYLHWNHALLNEKKPAPNIKLIIDS